MLQPAIPERTHQHHFINNGLRILVLDDSEFDLRRVSRLLSEIRDDVFVKTTKTLDEFETAFRANLYDLCLIDHTLSGGMTVAALKTVINEALDEVVLTEATHAERLEMVSQVIVDVARLYSGNTKEHLSKIYQTTNFLRECIARREWPSTDTLNEIEASCFSVWRFLDEVENHGMNFGRHPM